MTVKHVYVQQYGCWWRLSADQFRDLCRAIIGGDGYDLDRLGARQLAGQPRWMVYVVRGGKHFSVDPERPSYTPLDWDAETAQTQLAEFGNG